MDSEAKTIMMSDEISRNYSNLKKQMVTKIISYHPKSSYSLRGKHKFRIEAKNNKL